MDLKRLVCALVACLLAAGFAVSARAQTPASSNTAFADGTFQSATASGTTSYYGSSTTHTTGLSGYTRPPEIVALSASLKGDPDLVYEYVRNNVDTVFIFGMQKGALGALIDRSGTPFDQAALMVELLREAGVTAKYRYGYVKVTGATFAAWTGVPATNSSTGAKAACRLLAGGGIPGLVNNAANGCDSYSNAATNVTLRHVWVEVVIGGTSYVYDPSYKGYDAQPGVTRPTYTAGELVTAANTGATINGAEVTGLNVAAVDTELEDFAEDSIAPVAGPVESFVGGEAGRTITPIAIPPGGIRETSLDYPSTQTTSYTWTGDVPDQYRTRLTVTAKDSASTTLVSRQFFVDEIYGRRLRIEAVPSTSIQYHIMLDGVEAQPGSTVTPVAGPGTVELAVDHPYVGEWLDRTVVKAADFSQSVTILHGWGDASPRLAQRWAKEVADDAAVTAQGETLPSGDFMRDKLAAQYLAQYAAMAELTAGWNRDTRHQTHDILGVVTSFTTYASSSIQDSQTVVDADAQIGVATADESRRAAFLTIATLGASLQSSVVEQMMDAPDGASAARRMRWAAAPVTAEDAAGSGAPRPVKSFASSTGVASWVRFENSTSPGDPAGSPTAADATQWRTTLSDTIAAYADAGYQVTAASEAFSGPGEREGATVSGTAGLTLQRGGAFSAIDVDGAGLPLNMAIVTTSRTSHTGGGAPTPLLHAKTYQPPIPAFDLRAKIMEGPNGVGVDEITGEVGFATGSILGTGQGEAPYRLEYGLILRGGVLDPSTTFSASRRPLLGWVSNWEYELVPSSDGLEAMGRTHGEAAAPTIAAIAALLNTYGQSQSASRDATALIIAGWWQDRLTDNVVTIVQGGSASQYVRLADGGFRAPIGAPGTLTQTGARSKTKTTDTRVSGRGWSYSSRDYVLTTSEDVEYDFDYWTSGGRWGFRLADITYPYGVTVTLSYGSDGRPTSVTNTVGRALALSYESGTRVRRAVLDMGADPDRWVELNQSTVTATFTRGATTTLQTSKVEFRAATSGSSTVRPDAHARILKTFEPVNLTSPAVLYTYDEANRIERASDILYQANPATGNSVQYFLADGYRAEVLDVESNATIFRYNRYGMATREIDPAGNVSLWSYDQRGRLLQAVEPEGNSTAYAYDAFDRVVRIDRKPKPGSGLADQSAVIAYRTDFSAPATITDQHGRVTLVDYFSSTRLKSVALPSPTAGAPRPTTTYAYNSVGLPTSVVDPAGVTTTIAYDTNYYVSSDTDGPVENGDLNAYRTNVAGEVTDIIDGRGCVTLRTVTYDGLGRVTQVNLPDNYIETFTYDANGRVYRSEFGKSGAMKVTELSYTARGQVASITEPGGDTATRSYSRLGWQITSTSPENVTDAFEYDAIGRLTRIEAAEGTALQQDFASYTYTANGEVATSEDARGEVTSYTYDGFDRAIRIDYPDGKFETFAYDADDNLIQEQTRAGVQIAFTYDALGRPLSRTATGLEGTTYGWDPIGRLTHVYMLGLNGYPARTYSFAYNASGQLQRQTRSDLSTGWTGWSTTFEYDGGGNRSRITWPDGFYVTYGWDNLNRPSGAWINGTSLIASYAYGNNGLPSTMTYADGSSVTYAYEADNDLASETHNWVGGTSSVLSYTYDDDGKLLTRNTTDSGIEMIRPSTASETYGPANDFNLYPYARGEFLDWNDDGGLTSDGSVTLDYDPAGIVTGAAIGSTEASYAEDPAGNRIWRSVDGTVTNHLFAGSQEIAELSSTGTLLRRWIPGFGLNGNLAWREEPSGSLTYIHTDRLASTIALTTSGVPTQRFRYDPYGGTTDSLAGYPFRFTGHRLDAETGLYEARARVYHPGLGRFLQADPTGPVDGPHLYSYLGNDPLNFTDPLGLYPCDPDDPCPLPPAHVTGTGADHFDYGYLAVAWYGVSWLAQSPEADGAGGATLVSELVVTARPPEDREICDYVYYGQTIIIGAPSGRMELYSMTPGDPELRDGSAAAQRRVRPPDPKHPAPSNKRTWRPGTPRPQPLPRPKGGAKGKGGPAAEIQRGLLAYGGWNSVTVSEATGYYAPGTGDLQTGTKKTFNLPPGRSWRVTVGGSGEFANTGAIVRVCVTSPGRGG